MPVKTIHLYMRMQTWRSVVYPKGRVHCCQLSAGLTCRGKQPFALTCTPEGNSESQIHPQRPFFGLWVGVGGKNPCKHGANMQPPHRNISGAIVLNTTPMKELMTLELEQNKLFCLLHKLLVIVKL